MIYSRRTAGGRYGDWFIVAPPLTITEFECDELAERLAATVDDYHKELLGKGVLRDARSC